MLITLRRGAKKALFTLSTLLSTCVIAAALVMTQAPNAVWVISAIQNGTWTARVVGNAGAAVDAAQGASAPANVWQIGGIYNSPLPSLSTGQISAIQLDSSGRPIFVGAGTAGSAAGGVVTVQGVASMTPILANPGTAANWGVGATGAAVPANGVYHTGDAQSAEPSKATTGNLTGAFFDLVGKFVTSPYANRENYKSGASSGTTTGAITIFPASGSASLKEYITDVECGRTDAGTTAIYVTLNDGSSTILVIPNSGGGGGNNKTFNVPLVVAANTAMTATPSAGVTTLYCSAQGYNGY
jgi:hypothetical protein